MVPITRYWTEDVSALRVVPWEMRTYEDSDEISRNTKMLKASPVMVMPARPVMHSRYSAQMR